MVVVTVFLSILNLIEFHLVQNRKENCHKDHIPFNVKGNGNIVFSVHAQRLCASILHLNRRNCQRMINKSSLNECSKNLIWFLLYIALLELLFFSWLFFVLVGFFLTRAFYPTGVCFWGGFFLSDNIPFVKKQKSIFFSVNPKVYRKN